MSSPIFKAPLYEPSAYSFSGVRFDELPHLAKHYLADEIGLVSPPDAPHDILFTRYVQLAQKLIRSLEGNDRALVDLKNDARRKSVVGSQDPEPLAEAHNMARLHQVFGVLLPERQSILDDFVTRWDALIWLEMEGLDEKKTVQEQQKHRDYWLKRIIDHANQGPIKLDEQILHLEIQVRGNHHLLSLQYNVNTDETGVPNISSYPPGSDVDHPSEHYRLAARALTCEA